MRNRQRFRKELLHIINAVSRGSTTSLSCRSSDACTGVLTYLTTCLSGSSVSCLSRSRVRFAHADAVASSSPSLSQPQISLFSKQHGISGFSSSTSFRTAARIPSRAFSSAFAYAPAADPSSPLARYLGYAGLLVGSGLATYYCYPYPQRVRPVTPPDEHIITNWSGTHEARTRVYIQPETLEELEAVVHYANEKKQKIRAVGSGLSPNGIGLCNDGMVNLALMDKIMSIDKETKKVRVQAGARVAEVVEALRPHGLTLQNFASIREQQIGGFIQVGAHGTGAKLPPVDEQVVSLKLVTPGKGTLDLSAETDGDLFYLARCGLGALGVVAEVTLQCVPAHQLLENTFVTNMKQVRKNHKKWLQENKHLRYMWIPDTDTVVVVQCNPLPEGRETLKEMAHKYSPDERLSAARSLYREVAAKYLPEEEIAYTQGGHRDGSPPAEAGLWSGTSAGSREPLGVLSEEEIVSLSFTELRDKLLAFDPLNKAHVTKVNQAEAEYWKKSEGYRIGWSDEILGFDCGGQQWVSEMSFPTGTLRKPDLQDVKYMEQVLRLIKKEGIPAPAPIEQRWTASSRSPLSPASSSSYDTIYSWVGIIMYLPTTDEEQRAAITDRFFEYRKATQQQLWDAYGAFEHWAKIEIPKDEKSMTWLRERIRKRFPVEAFNQARSDLDPNNVLANDVIDQLFPRRNSTTLD